MEQEILLLGQGILAVLTGGIVEAIKRAGMDSKYAPLVSLSVGLLLGLTSSFLAPDKVTVYTGLFGGLLAGLVASGGYSAIKKMPSVEDSYKSDSEHSQ